MWPGRVSPTPEKRTRKRAASAKRRGKKPTTQAGAYVAEEMRHAKRGKHPVKSRKQAIAIGLSKARRSGVKVPKRGARRAKRTTAARSASRRGRGRSRRSRSRR